MLNMYRLLKFIIFGDFHLHNYDKHFEQSRIINYKNQIIGNKFSCRCKVCGHITTFQDDV